MAVQQSWSSATSRYMKLHTGRRITGTGSFPGRMRILRVSSISTPLRKNWPAGGKRVTGGRVTLGFISRLTQVSYVANQQLLLDTSAVDKFSLLTFCQSPLASYSYCGISSQSLPRQSKQLAVRENISYSPIIPWESSVFFPVLCQKRSKCSFINLMVKLRPTS